jgi:hypothetical protein
MFNLIRIFSTQTCNRDFLGLQTWYHYLTLNAYPNCDVQNFYLFPTSGPGGHASSVPLILLAILDDLLRIAGLVSLGYIIVGAVKFITSQGNSENATSARNTIISALAGLAISIVAVAFVNFIGNQIGQ